MGTPDRKLKQTGEEGEEGAGEEGAGEEGGEEGEPDGKSLNSDLSDKPEVEVPPKELVELDRLKYVVLAIENDCQIAPVGAFKMNAEH